MSWQEAIWGNLSFLEFIYTVNIGLHTGSNDIGVGTETIIDLPVVFHLHVYLAHVVGTFVDGLDGKFLEHHRALDDVFEGVDGGVDRTVAFGGGTELLTGNVEHQGGNGTYAVARSHLQIVELDAVLVAALRAGQDEDIVIGDFLFLVGQFEEGFVDAVELIVAHFNAERLQAVFQRGVSRTGREMMALSSMPTSFGLMIS